MKEIAKILVFLLLITSIWSITSCKKDIVYSKENLEFSLDTLLFDTVFTTVGSTTKNFKIYNPSNRTVLIENIDLMGGEDSKFRINVDGVSGIGFENIELEGGDSLFCFVEVTLDVNNGTNPLIILDSIRFRTNGQEQFRHLAVWGQDAYFHVNEIVQGNWQNDKPHVIYGIAAVGFPGLDSNLTLNIPAGTEIYLHNRSDLWVYKSTLNIQGELGNEVTFQGDRLEPFYDDKPGQWGRIILVESNPSTIDYAIIRNGTIGVQVEKPGNSGNNLTMTNTIIDNMNLFSFLINEGGSAVVENSLILGAGITSFYVRGGGAFDVRHTTIANFWTGSRSDPGFIVQNWFEDGENTVVSPVIGAVHNSVIWGNRTNEFILDTLDHPTIDFNFNHCVIRNEDTFTESIFNEVIWNDEPNFIDPFEREYGFILPSSLHQNGDPAFTIPLDIKGNTRLNPPSIGAIEIE